MTYPSSEVAYCPHCSAPNPATDTRCWICHQELGAADASPSSPPARPPQFALSSLMLMITLVCICLGLATIAPGLIIPLLFIVVPALLRTFATAETTARKRPFTAAEHVGAFITSAGIVIVIWVAGVIAFGTACGVAIGIATTARGDAPIFFAIGLSIAGAIGALILVIYLFRKTWPRRGR